MAPKTASGAVDLEKIRRFYLSGFQEELIHRAWPRLYSKQFKIRTHDNTFISLNRFRDRYSFRALKKACIHFTPVNLYMSVLNWLMPERVGTKSKANKAYPIGGEYVIDIDLYLHWQPHSHVVDRYNVCVGCLSISKDATLTLLDKITDNYSDVHVVFSGKRGFHIHVWDFDVRDWTHYDERNPIKSHEVARFVYTRNLKAACGGFDDHHFTLSSDPMRVVTFPESLNGETGLMCKYLGGPEEFERTSVQDILWRSKATRYFYNMGFESAVQSHSHPEPAYSSPRRAMTICAKIGGGERG